MIRSLMVKLALVILLTISSSANSENTKKYTHSEKLPKDKKTVSLVLGSGGARGYAHIGAIEVLEKQGYKIKSISGSSMGALIGGLYAAGKLEEYKKWVLTLDSMEVFQLVNFTFDSGGFVDGDGIYKKIESIIGDVKIEDLPITYTAVASDIDNQKEVWFQKGRLVDAIRASIAVPTIMTPIIKDGNTLVDGSVLNPLPITPVLSDGNDLIVGVDLHANIPNKYIVKIPKENEEQQTVLYDEVSKLWDKAVKFADINSSKENEIDIFSVFRKALHATQSILTQHSIERYSPDIIIAIPRDSCKFYEFDKAYELIEIGKMAARESLKIKNDGKK